MSNFKFLFYFVITIICFYITSFRNIYSKAPLPQYTSIIYIFLAMIIVFIALRQGQTRFEKMINKIPASLIHILLFLYIAVYIYITRKIWIWNNSLKSIFKDSTADDAMILTALEFCKSGISGMYSISLYDGAPVSPGPGWILLNSLFSVNNLYYLLNPFYLVIFIYSLYFSYKENFTILIGLLLLSSSTLFWSMSGVGHDLIGISFALGTVWLVIEKYHKSINIYGILVLGLFVGTLATSRIIFFIIIYFFALSLRNRKNFFLFIIIAGSIFLTWHFLFAYYSYQYPPLHLLTRGKNNIGIFLIMVGVIIEVILVGISFYNLLKYEGIDLLGIRIDFLIFFIPCFLISFGELVSVNYSFGLWEGANYVIPVWGSLLAVLIQEQKLRTEQRA